MVCFHTSVYSAQINSLIYLFGVLCSFQYCTGHITMGSWKGRGNQYIQFARVLYCKLPTNSKQLPGFPLKTMMGIEPRPQRWEARVLLLCHHGPQISSLKHDICDHNVAQYVVMKKLKQLILNLAFINSSWCCL